MLRYSSTSTTMTTVVVQKQAVSHDTRVPRVLSPVPEAVTHFQSTVSLDSTTLSSATTRTAIPQTSSLLYPPDAYCRLSGSPPIYTIDARKLTAALDHIAEQPLPRTNHVFPWLHGLHPENNIQLAFFTKRRRSLRRTPKCWRGITLIKVGGDLTKSRLKGAVAPDEVLGPSGTSFLDVDPREGFSPRNFQIQTAKLAAMSDIVVYGEEGVDRKDLLRTAVNIATAQEDWMVRNDLGRTTKQFNTFILTTSFRDIEENHPELVAIDSEGRITGQVMDFAQYERDEMHFMTKASEISTNVWLGPTPDYLSYPEEREFFHDNFDLAIHAREGASIPSLLLLRQVGKQLEFGHQRLDFPASGSINPPFDDGTEIDDLVDTIRWIYLLANPLNAEEDDAAHAHPNARRKRPRKIILLCPDGYTETSLLALAYFMYAEGVPAYDAWIRLHREKKRNFFAFKTDVSFLTSVQNRLLRESPAAHSLSLSRQPTPVWFSGIDGSLPSRILPYMYLGNLHHANNPDLLWALGIKRVLSIGVSFLWNKEQRDRIGEDNVMFISQMQDNGVDSLTTELDRCLEFIRKGKEDGAATLVHCRVGVSRSATICIAEVMASLNFSFPRAYCYVRARRLNVIIQPHLRFVYELLKWDELLYQRRGIPLKRELEWPTIAREISLLNMQYMK